MPRQRSKHPRLEQRQNGYWYVVAYDPKKRKDVPRSLGTSDSDEAHYLYGRVLAGLGAVPEATQELGPLISDLLTDYEVQHIEKSVVDKASATNHIRALRAHFGDVRLKEMTFDMQDSFFSARRIGKYGARPCSDGYIRADIAYLSAAFQHAAKYHPNVTKADIPHLKRPKKSKPRDRWLSGAECEALLSAAQRHERVYRFVVLGLGTAARKTDVVTLQRYQIDLASNQINFLKKGQTQTKKFRPTITMPDNLVPYVTEWSEGLSEGDYLLSHQSDIAVPFQTACRRAGIADAFPHCLRHTWATNAVKNGELLQNVAQYLGDSLQTVIDNYAHLQPDWLKDTANRNSLLG